jgi:flagellar hook-basal body complex protein FliE
MGIDKLGPAAASGPVQGPKQSFSEVLENAPRKVAEPPPSPAASVPGCPDHAVAGTSRVGGVAKAAPASPVDAKHLARAVEQVQSAQAQLDHVLQLAQSGKSFTPAELLAIQARVYSASQQLDLAGKVVEKATSGVKQVLQTPL